MVATWITLAIDYITSLAIIGGRELAVVPDLHLCQIVPASPKFRHL